jgi:hypothetical protein
LTSGIKENNSRTHKQYNAGSRQKKLAIINSLNPKWEDLWEKEFGINDEGSR